MPRESQMGFSISEKAYGQEPEESKASKMKRWQRVKVSAKEALKRMQAFGQRKEKFIAAVREGTA